MATLQHIFQPLVSELQKAKSHQNSIHFVFRVIGYSYFIGIDFKIKAIEIDQKIVKLQIWDTAGQERFRTITQTYYRGAMGIILAYDCSSQESFKNIKNWIKQIEQHAASDVSKILVANKSDKPTKAVST